jgi:hypothetical protein
MGQAGTPLQLKQSGYVFLELRKELVMNMRLNKSTVSLALKVSAIPLLMNLVAACSPVNFSTVDNHNGPGVVTNSTPPPTPPPGQTCTIETVYRKTKIMFVVDASGSNNDPSGGVYNDMGNGQNQWFPNSDPAKRFRGGAINNFFSTYQHKTNFSWSFSTFQGDSAHAYIGTDSNPRFSNPSDMSNAISAFYGASDSGKTPFAAGLAMAAQAIRNDPDKDTADQPNYFVIFLSDGFPTDYTENGQFNSARMQADVAARN